MATSSNDAGQRPKTMEGIIDDSFARGREAGIREALEAVCPWCRRGVPCRAESEAFLGYDFIGWMHGNGERCEASQIRALLEGDR